MAERDAVLAAPGFDVRDVVLEAVVGPPRVVAPAAASERESRWERPYLARLVVLDVLAVVIAGVVARAVRGAVVASEFDLHVSGEFRVLLIALAVPTWLAVLACVGAYDLDHLGQGSEEFRRVVKAGVYLLVVVSVVAFGTELVIARGFVGGFVPLAIVCTSLGRVVNRRHLRVLRKRGEAMHRVVVLGDINSAALLTAHLRAARWSGLDVVGVGCPDGAGSELEVDGHVVPLLASGVPPLDLLRRVNADVLAVTDASVLGDDGLRRLAYELEGTGVRLVVAPSLTDVAGPRISVRPVSGLPLLCVDEPRLSGPARLFKATFDRAVAAVALIVLAPVFLVVGMVVAVTSGWPVFYTQERVGLGERTFRIFKFRTMVRGADTLVDELADDNECDEVLFKMRDDPRVTRVGRWLRRYSIDELPQLVNVVLGQMSLVGPRPPLPGEVLHYSSDARRRLLVKPGLTGLGQVSGRSDLAWQEVVRLDLHYVDNWSPTLDVSILLRTAGAVLRADGAY